MILVADSGSTKTDWVLAPDTCSSNKSDHSFTKVKTQGINPFHQSMDRIEAIMQNELITHLSNEMGTDYPLNAISSVAFYGAGCNEASIPMMTDIMQKIFPTATIDVASDMLGAARALFGDEQGVACILGTGSNSCYYDGRKMLRNIPPLGYILGDEGGGASLGKLFLNGIFKGTISNEIRDRYLENEGFVYTDVIEAVYRKPLPHRFLASISKFILKNISELELQDLVRRNFDHFFKNNIRQYDDFGNKKISAIGSIAHYYKNLFIEIAKDNDYEVIDVVQSPLEGLLSYHQQHR